MKMPGAKFSPGAIGSFFLAHGEKIGASILGLVGLVLIWGGIDAVRLRSVSSDRRPDVILQGALEAEKNITAVPNAPAEELAMAATPFEVAIDPWRKPRPTQPASLALLDRPLREAAVKRTQPEILPLEDLRVATGVAVLVKPQAAGAGMGFPGEFPGAVPGFPGAATPGFPGAAEGGPAGPGKPKRGSRREKPSGQGAESASPGPGSPPMMAGGPLQPQVRVVPFAIVTGLVPARKQLQEYLDRFGNATFQDPRRDVPAWCDFEIDRCLVGADGQETWAPVDLQASAAAYAEWPGFAAETVPAFFLMAADEEVRRGKSTPLPFCGPLPQRIDAVWGDEAQHPWVKRTVRELTDQYNAQVAAATAAAQQQESSAAAVFQGGGGMGFPGMAPGSMPGMPPGMAPGMPPGMMAPGMSSPEMMAPGMMSGPGMPGSGAAATADALARRPEYRLFRFVDTAVEPGRRYRYRVRLKAWNPNWYQNPDQIRPHVTDLAITKLEKLSSVDSAASSPARVPGTTSLLLALVPDADRKLYRIKPGIFEILVMATAAKTGNFTLRSVLSELGGFANVDAAANRSGDIRSRGEDVATGMLLVDAVGEQLDQRDSAANARRPKGPPEPLEMLFVHADGSFEVVSAADSQKSFVKYRQTLPEEKDSRRGPPAPPPGSPGAPVSPFGSPFGQVSQ